jgi:hypothetical protein
MSIVLLVAEDHDGSVLRSGSRARLRDRLAARWRGDRLDRALAEGVAPDTDAALELRAHALIGAPMRRALADRMERAIRDALGARPRLSSRVVPDRRAVLDAADELETMVALLRGPGAVAVEGVARVLLLLGDGLGPLYTPNASPGLPDVVGEAIAALEPAGASA